MLKNDDKMLTSDRQWISWAG